MRTTWKRSCTGLVVLGVIAIAPPAADAGVPDASTSFYVPQRGTVASPIEGTSATTVFRACPNNEGGTSLPNNARIKVVVRDSNSNGVPGIAAADIILLFNGGTPAQGFSGVGADSIISNSQFNQSPLCPDLRSIPADCDTDATGTTYITFTGSTPGQCGVGTRDPRRKWGHFDSKIPVYVLGFELLGRLTTASAPNTYVLVIKSYDHTGGLGTALNQGEAVTSADFNAIANNIGVVNALTYWRDFDSAGGIGASDFNLIATHTTHDCDSPQNP
ncbi:MAG TPA: hypothetical protein VFP58_11475 [Candidatus Eisenbacteria bacterium]|nr:hypothetical protein [Candidatus Eisenbacteria bacterium]